MAEQYPITQNKGDCVSNISLSHRCVLLVTVCCFSRIAFTALLSPLRVHAITSLDEVQSSDDLNAVNSVVIHLQGKLTAIMKELSYVKCLMQRLPRDVTLVLITGMSLRCAQALLLLSEVEEAGWSTVRVIPDHLVVEQLGMLLRFVLLPDSRKDSWARVLEPLRKTELRALRCMVYGRSMKSLAQSEGIQVKTAYGRLYSALSRINVSGQHAMLCGNFRRCDQLYGISHSGEDRGEYYDAGAVGVYCGSCFGV